MKAAPAGFGYWVAFAQNMTPSPLAQDIAETCRVLKALGAGWVAPRAGMDGWNDGGLTVEALAAYKQLGIGCYPWMYTRPSGIASTVAAAVRLVATGCVDGIILDAEGEYLGQHAAAAKLADTIRGALGDRWIAHAPFDNIAFHPTFPYREIVRGSAKAGEGPRLDGVLPQLYAWEHDDSGHPFWEKKCQAQWTQWEAQNPDAAVPRHWIGCCYRPAMRAGKATPPLPLQTVIADVVGFRKDNPLGSLYSIDAAVSLGQRAILDALASSARAFDLSTVLGQQEALTQLGFSPGAIDGKKGPKTIAAIQAFQSSVGQPADGIVGPNTIAALQHALAAV
jgi:Putative peptidoglycan binding domain